MELRRIGKHIAIGLEDDIWWVLHLMIAERLHWKGEKNKATKTCLAVFEFESVFFSLTEAGSKKRARLSPVTLTSKLSVVEIDRLLSASQSVLAEWSEKLRIELGEKFHERVTAFRLEMAAHGRYRKPCSSCGDKIQRIRCASNETNYSQNAKPTTTYWPTDRYLNCCKRIGQNHKNS
jgi:formamidopyrimidine-DNA glycosylase